MMRQMRENTKWIMLITALAFVALMVFEWGMDLTGRSGAQATGGTIGRVNDEAVSFEEWNGVYRNLLQQQQQAAEGRLTSLMMEQIEDAAWDQVVMQKLLAQELRRRGIRVTDQEIRDAALMAPPPELMSAAEFQTDGQFDIAKYQQFIASPALPDDFLQQLEAYYRDIIPRSKLFFQNTSGIYVTDAQLWRMYRDANETATVRYIAFSPARLVSDAEVNVTDAQIREFYNEHREDFLRPAQATVQYVVLNRAPAADDSATALRQARQYATAIAGGEAFENVARQAGATDSLTRQYGEQFAVVRGESAPALEQAVFSTAAGQVTDPVLTQAGYHLVKVESRQADSAQVRQIIVPIELSRENENRLLDRADSLEAAGSADEFAQIAQRLGLQVSSAELSPALPILPGVGTIDEGLEWTFEDAAVGELSEILESDQAFYMLHLVSRQDEAILSLEEATPTIRTQLVRQARIETARRKLDTVAQRARAGAPLEEIAAEYQAQVEEAGPFTRGDFVPGLGRVNAAIGAAFGLQIGETSGLVQADDQLFLIRKTAADPARRAEWQAQLDEQRARVMQALSDSRWQQFVTALRENADIEDLRDQVLNQQANASR